MVEVQKEVRLLEAVRYISLNPTLSFHSVSVEFKVDVQELQDSYRLSRKAIPQNTEEL